MSANVGIQTRIFLKRFQVWLGMVALIGAATAVVAATIPNLFPFRDSTGRSPRFRRQVSSLRAGHSSRVWERTGGAAQAVTSSGTRWV